MLVYKGMSTDVPVCNAIPVVDQGTPPLPNDVPTLQAMILELLSALKKEQHERAGLQQRLDQLLRRLYGPKAERFDPNQPWLLPEMANRDVDQPEFHAAIGTHGGIEVSAHDARAMDKRR